jgi:hypothetical protein
LGSHLNAVFEVSATATVTAHRHVFIAVWRDTPTVTALLRVDSYVTKLREQYAAVAGVVVVDTLILRPPDHQARAEHARLTRKYEASGIGLAMIIDGRSPKHSLFRFVLTTIQLMSSPRLPQRICQSAIEAATWLAGLDPQLQRSQLASAIDASRHLPAQPKTA